MIAQIIGWICLILGAINFIEIFVGPQDEGYDKSCALFLIAAAICFK